MADTPILCHVCEMWLNGQAQYDDHLEGKKHRVNKLKAEGVQRPGEAGRSADADPPADPDSAGRVPDADPPADPDSAGRVPDADQPTDPDSAAADQPVGSSSQPESSEGDFLMDALNL